MTDIEKLIEDIVCYDKSIDSLRDTINELSAKRTELKNQLKKMCPHPDDRVELQSQGNKDDYGSFDGTDYWWRCNQCGCESEKADWDYDRGQYILGSRRPIANIYYKKLTKRDLPATKRPPF